MLEKMILDWKKLTVVPMVISKKTIGFGELGFSLISLSCIVFLYLKVFSFFIFLFLLSLVYCYTLVLCRCFGCIVLLYSFETCEQTSKRKLQHLQHLRQKQVYTRVINIYAASNDNQCRHAFCLVLCEEGLKCTNITNKKGNLLIYTHKYLTVLFVFLCRRLSLR